MKAAINSLIKLGVTENEAKAYVALIKENPASAYEISKISGIPSSKIYEVISKLESRGMVQSIHGESKRRLFIPAPPGEFIDFFRSTLNENLEAVSSELKEIKTGADTGYTWHIKKYENLILRSKRMLNTARESILLLIWANEMENLFYALKNAENRKVKTAVIHYGATNIQIEKLYRHPLTDTIYEQRNSRGFTLIADSKEVLTGSIEGKDKTEAIWSMNRAFVMMAEDYLRHDIYFMKLASRFNPIFQEKFGERYEKLRDVFTDEEN
ncbi:MAG: TrmB family transcriptional regulator [Nitrospirae bacterium]|nr:TrmB family transcriptional regulator [Nitrospirota bacterium]